MAEISRHTDAAGNIRVEWVSDATGTTHWFKFKSDPTPAQLQALSDHQDQIQERAKVLPVALSLGEYRPTIAGFVQKVKDQPGITLAQYNAFLSSLPWYDAAIIRAFVFLLGSRLADRKDINIAGQTETAFLQAVRNFIAAEPGWKIARLVTGTDEI